MKKLFTLITLLAAALGTVQAQRKTVTLTEAGTLAQQFDSATAYSMTSLTISGPMNGTDVKFLRDLMATATSDDVAKGKLTTLNLKNARFVDGGDVYFETQRDNGSYMAYRSRKDSIPPSMFYGCRQLSAITLPDSLVYIDSLAFCFCALKEITIPASVKGLGLGVFELNESLSKITLNEGLESVGKLCFYSCDALTSITFPNSVKEIGVGCFYWAQGLTYVKLPDSLEVIPRSCFEYSHTIKTLSIPKTVKRIEESAFVHCIALTSLVLPEGLEYIGEEAFAYCTRLQECTLPSTLNEVGGVIFAGDYQLTAGGIPLNEANPYFCTIDGSLFSKDSTIMYEYYNSGDTAYSVPSTVEEIAYKGLGYAYDLHEITLPPGLMMIDYHGIYFVYGVTRLISLAETPPDCVGQALDTYLYSTAKLYVPEGTKDDYAAAPVWKDFNIEEIPAAAIVQVKDEALQDLGPVYYDTAGRRYRTPQPGLNVVKYPDGSSKKIFFQ